jgi:hypothetical protein
VVVIRCWLKNAMGVVVNRQQHGPFVVLNYFKPSIFREKIMFFATFPLQDQQLLFGQLQQKTNRPLAFHCSFGRDEAISLLFVHILDVFDQGQVVFFVSPFIFLDVICLDRYFSEAKGDVDL